MANHWTRPPDQIVQVYDAAADTDLLSGTELDTPVRSGYAEVYANSSVATATMEAPQIGHKVGVTNIIALGSESSPKEAELIAVIPINAGEKPILALGGTTGNVMTKVCVWFA